MGVKYSSALKRPWLGTRDYSTVVDINANNLI